tara:strand:- start:2 stop:391 length:390 start_codon:yes stop_codon:yes gene_type:complete
MKSKNQTKRVMGNLEMKGTIKVVSEVQEGTAKSSGNAWKKLTFVIETGGEYSKDVAFTVFGEEKVDNFLKFNKVGQSVDVSFNAESREFNERYYTDLQAWKIFTSTDESGKEPAAAESNGFSKASDLPF